MARTSKYEIVMRHFSEIPILIDCIKRATRSKDQELRRDAIDTLAKWDERRGHEINGTQH